MQRKLAHGKAVFLAQFLHGYQIDQAFHLALDGCKADVPFQFPAQVIQRFSGRRLFLLTFGSGCFRLWNGGSRVGRSATPQIIGNAAQVALRHLADHVHLQLNDLILAVHVRHSSLANGSQFCDSAERGMNRRHTRPSRPICT